jgi:hypothetical protein
MLSSTKDTQALSFIANFLRFFSVIFAEQTKTIMLGC